MNVLQLESDRKTAVAKVEGLIETIGRACGEPGDPKSRLMTDAESASIKGAIDDLEAIDTKIKAAQTDAALMARFEQIRNSGSKSAIAPAGSLAAPAAVDR